MTFARAARLTLAVLLLGLAGAAGSAVRSGAENLEPAWTEVSWPFLLDEWGTGQAFRCADERCGPEAQVFVRVKRGFCNCFQGVADDAEVDRLTDFEFFGGLSRPLGAGRAIALDDRSGRVRSFAVDSAQMPSRRAVSLVVAKDCEALVVTLIADREVAAAPDAAILTLLPRTLVANLP
jgi:hypothetical protein